jgi:hypothetical protein
LDALVVAVLGNLGGGFPLLPFVLLSTGGGLNPFGLLVYNRSPGCGIKWPLPLDQNAGDFLALMGAVGTVFMPSWFGLPNSLFDEKYFEHN